MSPPKEPDEIGDFKLSRYDDCAAWKFETWRHALHLRRIASTRLHRAKLDIDTKWSKETIAYVIKEVKSFLKDPSAANISNPPRYLGSSDSREIQGVSDRTLLDEFVSFERVKNGVFSPWEEIHAVWQNEDPDNLSAAIREVARETGTDITRRLHELERRPLWQVEPLHGTPDFFVSISLEKPDAELVRDFKEWLKRTRQESGFSAANTPISTRLMGKWHDNRVLAYIDLCLYSKACEVKVTNERMATLLFSERCDFLSEVDKLRTAKKYADAVMKDSYFYSMRHHDS